MLNTHKLLRIAITTSALVALCATQLVAHAETVSITGDIQGETCALRVRDGKDNLPIAGPNFTLPLGTFDLTVPSDTAAAGTVFGTETILRFSLVSPGTTSTSCNFSNGASRWDISIAPAKSGYITTINGATFLSNMVSLADGGTNAVVKLTGGLTNPPLNAITFTEAGSYVSSPSAPFKSTFDMSISLFAQFAFPVANQKPTSGVYSSTLTFAVTYR